MTDSKPTIAVVLSGCGVYDGAEVHEAVLTMLALDRQGAAYRCFAPDIPQHHVVNHITGEEMPESRNVLVEAARIARGEIEDLAGFDAAEVDAIIFPGGFGAAKNLSTFAFDGAACSVQKDVEAAVRAMAEAGKPIGALCIAPAFMARLFPGSQVTIGAESDFTPAIGDMGSTHVATGHGDVVIDEERRLVTAPCYMLESSIGQIAEGADNAVRSLLDMVRADRAAA